MKCFSSRVGWKLTSKVLMGDSGIVDAEIVQDAKQIKVELLRKAGMCVRGEIASEEEKVGYS